MIFGVNEGYYKGLELVGVGFKATLIKKNILELNIGYSHNIMFIIPDCLNISLTIEKGKNTIINLYSIYKDILGNIAYKIRSLRKPDVYKGKGIKYLNEKLYKKIGKSNK